DALPILQQLPVGREAELQVVVLRLGIGRPWNRSNDLVVLQVVLNERRSANLAAVDERGGGTRDEHHEAVLRIDVERERADVSIPFAQREGVERLSARHVDDLEALLIGALD